MNDIIAILEKVYIENLIRGEGVFLQKNKTGQALLAFAGCCFAVGIVFLVAALYLWVLPTLGQHGALALGGFLLILASVLSTAGLLFYRYKKLLKIKQETSAMLQMALEMASEQLGEAIDKNPKTTIIAAYVAGYILSKKLL